MKTNTWKVVVAGAFVVLVLWILLEDEQAQSLVEEQSPIVSVSSLEAQPGEMSVGVQAIGVTVARWPIDILASVSGRVIELPTHTEPGNLLEEKQLLVAVLDTSYKSELQAAKARVAQAELELSKNKHEQYVVSKVSGGKKLSAFGRFEPHIKAAEAELKAAQAALNFAQQQADDTRVKTPFPAVVLNKAVTPGQWINNGEVLFSLAAKDFIDIKVELSADDWARLGKLSAETNARVVAPSGASWQATVRYLSPVMDATTRQRSLMLQVADPYSADLPLLPDQQVKVEFDGPLQPDVVTAPASVLTQDGKVWSINKGVLQLEEIELLDEQPESVSFRYRQSSESTRLLVLYPLSTMLEGQRANPDIVTASEGNTL